MPACCIAMHAMQACRSSWQAQYTRLLELLSQLNMLRLCSNIPLDTVRLMFPTPVYTHTRSPTLTLLVCAASCCYPRILHPFSTLSTNPTDLAGKQRPQDICMLHSKGPSCRCAGSAAAAAPGDHPKVLRLRLTVSCGAQGLRA
jgi:hypothetical protein